MNDLLLTAFGFPSVVFTVLLGVVLAYWALVFLGALSVNLLGGGDVGLDGHDLGLDGHDLGLDGHDVGLDGHGDVGDAGDAGGAEGHDVGNTSILGALKLRSAPATLVLSLIITFSWLFSVLLSEAVHGYVPSLEGFLTKLAVLVVAPLLSLPFVSVTIRPLAPLFVVHQARAHKELVGQVVTIRSGSVTKRFGEATFDDGAAGFIVQVRTQEDEGLARGEQALLVSWDETHDTFTVAPMKDLLARPVNKTSAGTSPAEDPEDVDPEAQRARR